MPKVSSSEKQPAINSAVFYQSQNTQLPKNIYKTDTQHLRMFWRRGRKLLIGA
jgi:hypothetical protein